MSEKFLTYDDWTAKKFITATELEKFIDEIKPQLIDKPLEKIIITGKLFDYSEEDEIKNEEYCAELDEPAILCFGDVQFEINFIEHSLAQIGINTLKENNFVSDYGEDWREINKYYDKNLIGQKLKDIYITKTDKTNITWEIPRNDGDDMYSAIVFAFDNNYKLVMDVFTDYMNISEVKP